MGLYYPEENAAVDIVAFLPPQPNSGKDQPEIILIQRKDNGRTALPGGFIDKDEHPHQAAVRELKEETNIQIHPASPTPLTKRGGKGTFRDPRDTEAAWVTTQPFLVKITEEQAQSLQAQDDASTARCVPLDEALAILNFADHKIILEEAAQCIKNKSQGPFQFL